MRRLVLWSIGGVFLINLIGISLISVNFLNFSREVERTVLINRSLLVRTEVFEKSLSLLDDLEKKNKEKIRIHVSEINRRLSECYSCHHSENTLSRISATRNLFEMTSRLLDEGKKISSGDISMVIQGFITYRHEDFTPYL